jgi:enterochelin esterase-like enzyme
VQNAPAEQRPRREVTWVNPLSSEKEGLTHHILNSKNLGHDVGYVVWTPPSYNYYAKKRFPVIYFLHGAGGDESKDAIGFSDWVKKGIDQGVIPPVICVFPNGGMSGYRGEAEKMIVDELIPLIDQSYRTIANPKAGCWQDFRWEEQVRLAWQFNIPDFFVAQAAWAEDYEVIMKN